MKFGTEPRSSKVTINLFSGIQHHALAKKRGCDIEEVPVIRRKLLQAFEAAFSGDLLYRQVCGLQQHPRVGEPDGSQVLIRRLSQNAFEYSAEMKEAYATMVCQFAKPDILPEMIKNIGGSLLDGR